MHGGPERVHDLARRRSGKSAAMGSIGRALMRRRRAPCERPTAEVRTPEMEIGRCPYILPGYQRYPGPGAQIWRPPHGARPDRPTSDVRPVSQTDERQRSWLLRAGVTVSG